MQIQSTFFPSTHQILKVGSSECWQTPCLLACIITKCWCTCLEIYPMENDIYSKSCSGLEDCQLIMFFKFLKTSVNNIYSQIIHKSPNHLKKANNTARASSYQISKITALLLPLWPALDHWCVNAHCGMAICSATC